MPRRELAVRNPYHGSPECWSVFGEVLAREFGDAVLFARVHQLGVDAYAAQHAGGAHRDKSVCVHLVGLHLALVDGVPPRLVPPRLQALVAAAPAWPHWPPPAAGGGPTVADVALAATQRAHVDATHAWARAVWASWAPRHAAIAALARRANAPRA
jgi:hypothetical protein